MRNVIDVRNVLNDFYNCYYVVVEFIDKVIGVYLINGVLVYFGMVSLEDQFLRNIYEGFVFDNNGKRKYVDKVILDFLDEYVVYNVLELSYIVLISNDLKCRVCQKVYKRFIVLKKYEEEKYGIMEVEQFVLEQSLKDDKVRNYIYQFFLMLLLRLDYNDVIKYGDGDCVIRLYKYFCLYFKVLNCFKYVFVMF